MALDAYGDFVVGNYSDLGTVSGGDNLVQAIKNMLNTEIGDLAYNSSYGVDLSDVIGRKNIYEKVMLIKQSVQTALLSDPRIQTIISIDVLQDMNNPSILYASIVAMPIQSQTPISLNMVFPWNAETPLPSNLTTVTNEAQTSISKTGVKTQYKLYNCTGVWLATDTSQTGVNYFLGGYVIGNLAYLGFSLPSDNTEVMITYSTLDTTYPALIISEITNETTVSQTATQIQTARSIYTVDGVWLGSDVNHTGFNYWSVDGGSFSGNSIILGGTGLPGLAVPVSINYSTSVRVSS